MNTAIVSASKSSHKRGPAKNAHRKFQRRLAQHRTRMRMLFLDLYYTTPEWFDRSKAIADSIHRIEAIIRRVEAWRKSLPPIPSTSTTYGKRPQEARSHHSKGRAGRDMSTREDASS